MTVPDLLDVCQVAKAIGLTTEKTRRLLAKEGLAQRIGGCWMVVTQEFAATMPVLYRIVADKHDGGSLKSKRGGKRPNQTGRPRKKVGRK